MHYWTTQMKNLVLNRLPSGLRDRQGAVLIIVALMMVVLLGFAALAIDLGHLYVARNELQNAADAGALAGASVLYNADGTQVNSGANQVAYDAATANKSENAPVEVDWPGSDGINSGDVQRGHWSFATRTFTPNASTDPVDLWNVSSVDLDNNPDFINAVKVVARRKDILIASFFARIFGYSGFQLSATAVAYLGFAGTLTPTDVDEPIAICSQSLLNEGGEYSCNIGRMINSGQSLTSSETGGWTSFSQDDPCSGGTNAQEVSSLICSGGNPGAITLNEPMATNGGEIQSAFNQLRQCWLNQTGGTSVWSLTLPVVNCPGNNVGTCETVTGAVTLNIVWITEAGTDPSYSNAPIKMDGSNTVYGSWDSSTATDISDPTNGLQRWQSFVKHFNLQNVDGSLAPYDNMSIYFLPDCTYHDPIGVSGGANYGILAKIPVLVK